MKHQQTALVLLLLGVFKNNTYKLAPDAMQGYAWSVSQSLLISALLLLLGALYSSREVWFAVALLAGFELQVAACSIAFMWAPWPVVPGGELCSSGLHFPVGAAGLWASVCMALYLKGKHDNSKP